MKYMRGFLMAWGGFCRIPCPYRKWNEEDRYAMLNMFPFVGLFLGILTCIAWWLLDLAGTGGFFAGGILTALYFWMTGFIHLDGFMDCSDAVLSRRPLAERQRILKDSHVGAFAVISLAFMLILFTASMSVIAEEFTISKAAVLCVIFTVSRELSAYNVINRKPMTTSQYGDLSSHSSNEQGFPGIIAVTAAGLLLLILFGSGLIGAAGADGSRSTFSVMSFVIYVWVILIQAAIETMIGRSMRQQLGGMNGDISGYMIVSGEMTGVILLALAAGF